MAKTTKQTSAKTGESGAELAKMKATSRKVAAKKGSAESPQASKTATTKKAVTEKSATSKTAAGKAASRKKVATGAVVHRQISSAERRRMIAEAAYLRSEAQGFQSDEQEDWLLAEAEVDNLLIRSDVIVSD
jgi:Protein of unknown function (DUF2934)